MIMSSYDLSERYNVPHSELCIMICNIAAEMRSETMRFDDKGGWFELNTFAAAMIIFLIEGG